MFSASEDEEFNPQEQGLPVYEIVPLAPQSTSNGRFRIRGKRETGIRPYFVVVIMLAAIGLCPNHSAVMGISRDRLVIYTSNIFVTHFCRSFSASGATVKIRLPATGYRYDWYS